MSRAAKITRQISVLMLVLVFVSALVLASGLIVFSRPETELLAPGNIPLVQDPSAVDGVRAPDTQVPAPGSSLTILSACLLVVFTVVLLWFLVFRPIRPEAETPSMPHEKE